MRKARATTPPQLPVLPREYHDLVRDSLLEAVLSFIAGTNTEDPKLYAVRLAAANAAIDMLTKLRDANGAPVLDAEPTQAEVITSARVSMAEENKS
jgi:uncharacterized protein (DUF4213/DUF364 family)